jgi:hypothetical protein
MIQQLTCPECGVHFWVEDDWLQALKSMTGRTIFCPNGHQAYVNAQDTPWKHRVIVLPPGSKTDPQKNMDGQYPGTIIVKESTDEQQAAQAPLQGGPALSDQR